MAKPQSTLLTEKTMGIVIQRLRYFLRHPHLAQNQFGQNPLHVARSGDKAWGRYMDIPLLPTTEVTVHPFFRHRSRFNDTLGLPMVHVKFNETAAAYFVEGDRFYWFGGSQIIIDRAKPWHDGRRHAERMVRISLTAREVEAIHQRDAFEKKCADDYWESVRRDAEEEDTREAEDFDPEDEPFWESDWAMES